MAVLGRPCVLELAFAALAVQAQNQAAKMVKKID
jgi:hypothetical protein